MVSETDSLVGGSHLRGGVTGVSIAVSRVPDAPNGPFHRQASHHAAPVPMAPAAALNHAPVATVIANANGHGTSQSGPGKRSRTLKNHSKSKLAPFSLLIAVPEGNIMRSLQIHPPLSPPHALITVHQPPSKTRRRRNVMTTPADPPVAAPWVHCYGATSPGPPLRIQGF